ncbi:MAG: TAXI family TRAP transporter solute-binding subunit, partial [Granulosicoccus sp.]
VDVGTEAADVATKNLPGSFILELNGGSPGEGPGRHAIAFDYALFAHKDVSDEAITAVVKSMHDNPDALKETSPLWKSFDPANMAKDVGVEFHPAAIAFYKEQGIWQR